MPLSFLNFDKICTSNVEKYDELEDDRLVEEQQGAVDKKRDCDDLKKKEKQTDNISKESENMIEFLKRVNEQINMLESEDDSMQNSSTSNLEDTEQQDQLKDEEKSELNVTYDSTFDTSTENESFEVEQENDKSTLSINEQDEDVSPTSFRNVSIQVQELGKRVKSSKIQVTWMFQQGQDKDLAHHFVTMTWSKRSGKVHVHMDGNRILSEKLALVSHDPSFKREWKNNGLTMQILASRTCKKSLSLTNYVLTVNGERIDHQLVEKCY
mmetsp:Transcript_25815/g.31828  ORF Transcript_25815/g.31828 Transcript_25815/m.31828 type:complete len:268 (+) Transcript_25815:65-868(+)